MSQNVLAYTGAAIIILGTATMLYAPEVFYSEQMTAAAVTETTNSMVAEAPKR
ncbi:MAG: hypothetical protein AAF557_17480 [Pseudomonadota bacterium]